MATFYSLEAEQHLLGAALISQDAIPDVLETSDDWWYDNRNKLILRAIRALAGQSLETDSFSVGNYLQGQQQLEMAGGMEYVMQLAESMPSLRQIGSFKRIMLERYKMRQIDQIRHNMEMQLGTSANPAEIVEYLQTAMIDLMTDHHSGGFKKAEKYLDEVVTELEWREQNKGKLLGQATGHEDLDLALDGFQGGRVYVLAGRPGSGKTAMALNLADRLSHKESHWFYFSLEMTGKALTKRLMVMHSKVPNFRLRSGYIGEEDNMRLANAIGKIQELNLHVDQTPGLAIAQIRSRLKAAQIKYGTIGGVIVDHIGLVKKDSRKSDTESMNQIADDLLHLAKEFDCPMLELAQLNRGVEGRTDKRPMLSDLKQSGKIEENADVVMMLYRGDYYDRQASPVTELDLAKNRDGETKTVYFKHDMSTGSYEELPDYEPPKKEKEGKF